MLENLLAGFPAYQHAIAAIELEGLSFGQCALGGFENSLARILEMRGMEWLQWHFHCLYILYSVYIANSLLFCQ